MARATPDSVDPVVDAREISEVFEVETRRNFAIEMNNIHCDGSHDFDTHIDHGDHFDTNNPPCPPPPK